MANQVNVSNSFTFAANNDLTLSNPIMAPAASATINVSAGTGRLILGALPSGAASSILTKSGGGTLVMAGNNAWQGAPAIIISQGTLQIGNGGTSGIIGPTATTVTDNAALVVNRSDAVTIDNVIGGTGTVAQISSGELTLSSGNSTYSGGTTFSGGACGWAQQHGHAPHSRPHRHRNARAHRRHAFVRWLDQPGPSDNAWTLGSGANVAFGDSVGTGGVTLNGAGTLSDNNAIVTCNVSTSLSNIGSAMGFETGAGTLTAGGSFSGTLTVNNGGLSVNGACGSAVVFNSSGYTLADTSTAALNSATVYLNAGSMTYYIGPNNATTIGGLAGNGASANVVLDNTYGGHGPIALTVGGNGVQHNLRRSYYPGRRNG